MASPVDRAASATFRTGAPAAWALFLVLAPRDGARDFARVYAYFRWLDDRVDAPDRDPAAVAVLLARQRALLAGGGSAEEIGELAVLAALEARPVVRPAVEGMLATLEADASRPPTWTLAEVEAQTDRIGEAYAVGVHACAGAGGAVPPVLGELTRAATRVHQLRDLEVDRDLGYCNVPAEVLAGRDPRRITREALAPWIRERAEAAAGILAQPLGDVHPVRYRLLVAGYAYGYRRLAEKLARDPARAPRAGG